ncbi:marine proteobacterial sortase target protein [Aestuariivirga litoralis]|uniref:marine proteobacterial sortase target protein n=1 Tax=Aestuariivirga litoralis TaxID=2650924 RepID=UPI001FF02C97|nr:marine proteobacterial sortase target protein [Aestuariivirga litoralis]
MLTSLNPRRPIWAAAFIFLSSFLILAKAAFAVVGINDMQSGSLLFNTKDANKFVEAPKVATDYTTTVSGPTARTVVTQQFYNPSDSWIEGVYVFPLPDNSAVDTLKIVSGTRVIVGEVKEKVEAKQEYEKAKADGKSAALLEQVRPNLFTNSVANIGPHEKILVQIEYQETVAQSSGTYSLRLPLVVAPRYEPAPIVQSVDFNNKGLGTTTTQVPQPPVLYPATDGVTNPVSITVNLNAGFDLGDVKSSFHAVDVTDKDAQSKVVKLAGIVPADRDFELTWKAKGDAPQAGLFKQNVNGHDYLLGFITPPDVNGPGTNVPRDITFVIDNSGSMDGASMPQAKASLLYGLAQLKPDDLFNVIRFDDTMTNVFGGSIPASEGNVQKAKDFVDALTANGGTEMVAPMKDALNDATPSDKGHLRQVVFITDGEISNEQELFDAIAKGRGRSRVFMVGIGSAPNTYLMTRAAELGRGSFTQIGEPNQLTARMTELFGKIGHPVITDLKAEIAGSNAKITPENLPDVYRGEPVMFFADDKALSGTVKLTGKIGDQPWEVSLPVDKAAAGDGIAKLWARRKIAEIEVATTLGQMDQASADKAVLSVALEHQLVSSQTSLIAIDKSPKRPPGYVLTRADVPLNLPAGWVWESVFGPKAVEDAPKMQKTEADLLQPIKAKMSEAAAPVALPQTATDARLLTLLAMLLALGGVVLLRKKETA